MPSPGSKPQPPEDDVRPGPLGAGRHSISLTLACALAFLSALQAFAFAFGPDYRHLGESLGAPWLPRFILWSSLVAMLFLVALWALMRRWAVWGFLAVAAAQSGVLVHLGEWRLTMLVLPAVISAAAAWNWARLR